MGTEGVTTEGVTTADVTTPQKPRPGRFADLDGLRGVAALVVVIGHSLLVSPILGANPAKQHLKPWTWDWLLNRPPLNFFWDGAGAVYVFFVLSGFVLVLPFLRSERPSWRSYYPRRVLRLYLPVWGAVLFSIALAKLVTRKVSPGQSWWINSHAGQLGLHGILHDVILLKGTNFLDSPLWSLQWEVIFSLLLPVYIVGVRLTGRYWPVLGAGLAAVIAVEGPRHSFLLFLPIFGFGVILAFHRESLRRLARNRFVSLGVLAVSLVLLSTNTWVTSARATGLLETIGAVGVVAVVLLWPAAGRPLRTKQAQALGRWSFSLYLVHEPIVVSIALLLHTTQPLVVLALGLPASLAVSAAFFWLVERRSHRLANVVGSAMDAGGFGGAVENPDGSFRHSTSHRLLSGTLWNALAQFAPILVNIVMTPYLIHHLGVDRWGLIALVTTIQSILTAFDGGLTQTTTRFFSMYAGTDDRAKTTRMLVTVVLFILAVGLVVSVPAWFVSPGLVHLFAMPHQYRPETTFYLRAVTALIALGFVRNVIAAVITARQRFAVVSSLGLLSYLVWIVGLVITVHGNWGLRGVAVTFLAQQALATVAVLPLAGRYLDRHSVGILPGSEARALFSYSGKVQVLALSQLFNAEFDSLLIGTALSVHGLAMYSTGTGLATQVSGIFNNAIAPAETQVARVFGASGDLAARAAYKKLQRIWVVGCNAIYGAALGGAYYAIINWLGKGFSLAGAVATLMVAGQGFFTLCLMLGIYCGATGRPGIQMRTGLVSVVLNVGFTVGLVWFGVFGVATATVLGWLGCTWYLLRDCRRRIGPDIPSFLDDISPRASIITIAVVLGMEYLIHPYVPVGPLGLVISLIPCGIGLAVFAAARFGPRQVAQLARDTVHVLPQGPKAVLTRMAEALPGVLGEPLTAPFPAPTPAASRTPAPASAEPQPAGR